jgi:hypothetical protein
VKASNDGYKDLFRHLVKGKRGRTVPPRERPILMSGPLVRAILDGKKTVTRRPVKGMALEWLDEGFTSGFVADPKNQICPYGFPGDRLWVKETHAVEYLKDAGAQHEDRIVYRADLAARWLNDLGFPVGDTFYLPTDYRPERWHPSIFMARWASRILLEVVSVRVERLQDITEEDARREGVGPAPPPSRPDWPATYRGGFAAKWDEIYGQGAWAQNDWVWVLAFRRLQP